MANAIAPQRVFQCMVYIEGDGWMRGKCQENRAEFGGYIVEIEPIPAELFKRAQAEGWASWYSMKVMMSIPADDPKFRLILSDEVTFA